MMTESSNSFSDIAMPVLGSALLCACLAGSSPEIEVGIEQLYDSRAISTPMDEVEFTTSQSSGIGSNWASDHVAPVSLEAVTNQVYGYLLEHQDTLGEEIYQAIEEEGGIWALL